MGEVLAIVSLVITVASVAYTAISAANQPTVIGPKLGDLSISTATYGLPIVRGWGVVRQPGNMIWTSGIKETTHNEGGKGGSKQEVRTFTYSASFAMAFGVGPASRVLRIWADSKLVYDETGTTSDQTSVPGLTFRFHAGDETQLPDPTIEADKGVGNVPAHRGLVYIVADDVELAPFGNRIPNVSAEIAYDATSASIYQNLDRSAVTGANAASDPLGGTFDPDSYHMAYDWSRNWGYIMHGGTHATTNAIEVVELFDFATVKVVALADMFTGTAFTLPNPTTIYIRALAAGNGVDLYLACFLGGDQYWVVRVNPESMKVTGLYGSSSTGAGLRSDNAAAFAVQSGSVQKIYNLDGTLRPIVAFAGQFRGPHLFDGSDMTHLWGSLYAEPSGVNTTLDYPTYAWTSGSARFITLPGKRNSDGSADVIIINYDQTSSDTVALYKATVSPNAAYSAVSFYTSNLLLNVIGTLSVSDIWPTGTPGTLLVQRAEYDQTNDAIIMSLAGDLGIATYRLISVDSEGGIIWNIETSTAFGAGMFGSSGTANLTRSTFGYNDYTPGNVAGGINLNMVDTATGEVTFSGTVTGPHQPASQTYNAATSTVFQITTTDEYEKIKLNRGAGVPSDLATIVTAICEEAGLEVDDLDVTELTDEVLGFTRGQEEARSLIMDLGGVFFFDGVESDDTLCFRKRGRSSSASVPYADIVRVNGDATQPALPVKRIAAETIPRRLWLRYQDVSQNYQQGSQHAGRVTLPETYRVVNAKGEGAFDTKVVLGADAAKTLVTKRLLMMWKERDGFPAVGLPPAYLALEPTDVITVEMRDGTSARVRIEAVEVGGDNMMNVRGIVEQQDLTSLTRTGYAGDGVTPQVVAAAYTVYGFLANMPLLRDQDDLGGSSMRFYAGGAAYAGQTFGGATLYTGPTSSSFSSFGSMINGIAWGTAVNALAAPTISAWLTDPDQYLDVAMTNGSDRLTSATWSQVLDGANPFVLVCSDGSVEVLQFTTVTSLGGSLYRLSGLTRGRRGSEWACAGHAVGDLFALLEATTFVRLSADLGWLDVARYAKTVGRNDAIDAVAPRAFTFTGEAETPYAPTQVKATRDGSLNITLTWVRRSRYAGEWVDGTEYVPIAEELEKYEVDVMNGSTVVRTITGILSPTTPYSAANQVTDFGSAQASLLVRVYQISGAVGRGHKGEATV